MMTQGLKPVVTIKRIYGMEAVARLVSHLPAPLLWPAAAQLHSAGVSGVFFSEKKNHPGSNLRVVSPSFMFFSW